VQRTYPFSKHSELVIGAEMAKIQIYGIKQAEIQIKISLVSKNTDQNAAKNELKYIDADIHKVLNKIYIDNFTIIPANAGEVSSNFQTIYEIGIPESYSIITVENKLGNIKMMGLKGNFTLKVEYTDVELQNMVGNLTLESKFGDIVCDQCKTTGNFTMDYSKVNLLQLSGENEIKTKSGTLFLEPDAKFKYVVINSKYTGITIVNKGCAIYDYNLSANLGSINVTESCILKNDKNIKLDTRKTKKDSPRLIYHDELNNGSIKIHSDFEDVNIY
jgi:hypothetical protein